MSTPCKACGAACVPTQNHNQVRCERCGTVHAGRPGQAMTGTRNESSVLFSLDHLKTTVAGRASSDGSQSGLIDIRAMAAAARPAAPETGAGSVSAVSAIPSLGLSSFGTPPFGTPSVLMPTAQERHPWWLIPSLVLGAGLLVAVVGLTAAVMLVSSQDARASEKRTPRVALVTPSTATSPVATDPIASPQRQPVEAATRPTLEKSPVVVKLRDPDPAGKGPKPVIKQRRHRRPQPITKPITRPYRDPKPTVAKPGSTPKPGAPSLLGILNGTMKPGQTPKVTAKSNLPKRLTRGDMNRGVGKVTGTARSCGRRYGTSGLVNVRLVVSGKSGRVIAASAKGRFASTETGRCVAKVLARASFKRFSDARHSFYYPVLVR